MEAIDEVSVASSEDRQAHDVTALMHDTAASSNDMVRVSERVEV